MEGIDLGAGLGALGFWGFLAAVTVAAIWYYARKREAQHETLRRMIESGQPIDHALVDKLLSLSGGGSEHLDRDLKISGLITLFIAPGLALMGWFISQESEQALLPLLGVSALVGFIGIGLLVASKAVRGSDRENDVPNQASHSPHQHPG